MTNPNKVYDTTPNLRQSQPQMLISQSILRLLISTKLKLFRNCSLTALGTTSVQKNWIFNDIEQISYYPLPPCSNGDNFKSDKS